MKTRACASTGLQLTDIGFGTASIGNLYHAVDDTTAIEVVHAAYTQGIRYFDTAAEYGHGLAEQRLGQALRAFPRDSYVLSTKVGDLLYAQANKLPAENKFIDKLPFFLRFDYSYDGIMRCFEDALQRLGTHKIDILYVHDLDPIIHTPDVFEKHFEVFTNSGYRALDQLRQSGAVTAIGLGVKSWQVCERALEHGNFECFMLQGNYTLLEQEALDTFFPMCEQRNISINLAGPFASGVLATGSQGGYFHHQPAKQDILTKVKHMEVICEQYDVPLAAVAIQFPLMHPVITSVVFGTRSIDRLQQNLRYYRYPIPAQLWQDFKAAGLIHHDAPVAMLLDC